MLLYNKKPKKGCFSLIICALVLGGETKITETLNCRKLSCFTLIYSLDQAFLYSQYHLTLKFSSIITEFRKKIIYPNLTRIIINKSSKYFMRQVCWRIKILTANYMATQMICLVRYYVLSPSKMKQRKPRRLNFKLLNFYCHVKHQSTCKITNKCTYI